MVRSRLSVQSVTRSSNNGCKKTKKMANSTDVSNVNMARFGYTVDLIREGHVRVKDEAKIAS